MSELLFTVTIVTILSLVTADSCVDSEIFSEWQCKRQCANDGLEDLWLAVWANSAEGASCVCDGETLCSGQKVCQQVTMVSSNSGPKTFNINANNEDRCNGRPLYQHDSHSYAYLLRANMIGDGSSDYWVVGASQCSTAGLDFKTSMARNSPLQLPSLDAQWASRNMNWEVDDNVEFFCSDAWSPPAPLSARPVPSPDWKMPERSSGSSGPTDKDKLLLGLAVVMIVLCACSVAFGIYYFLLRSPSLPSLPKWSGDFGHSVNPYVMGMYRPRTRVESMDGQHANALELTTLTTHQRSDAAANVPVVVDPHGFQVMDNPLSRVDPDTLSRNLNPNVHDIRVEDETEAIPIRQRFSQVSSPEKTE